MQWIELHPGCMDAVETEINEAVGALHKLEHSLSSEQKKCNLLQQSQSSSNKTISASKQMCGRIQSAINSLLEAMQRRICELRDFYDLYDMDPRAETAERCRLLLKRKLLERGVAAPVTSINVATGPLTCETPHDYNYSSNRTPSRRLPSSIAEDSRRFVTPGNPTPINQSPKTVPNESDWSGIKLKVILTQEEYFEVLKRRSAISEMMS
eukprot:Tbor_TRINITY_DN1924_c0_g1::TRINITY_DN1924_c0_g1_i1::g.3471::m.3471